MRFIATGIITLVMTAASFAASDARTYTVAAGDSVATIAVTTNTSAAEITRLNGLQGDLRPGTVLVLDEADVVAPDPVRTAEALRRLAAAEAAMIPTEGADLAMWGGSEGKTSAAMSKKNSTPSIRRLTDRIVNRTSSIAANLTRSAMRFIGVPYSFGGTSASGFDCSGYVQHVFAMLGIAIPRTADAQYAAGQRVAAMQAGDLVFFQTYAAGASHVGIYLGNGNFVHSSSSHGVTVSALRDSYWAARYLGAKRVASLK